MILPRFIEEHYEVTEREADRISKAEVNATFERWCNDMGRRDLCTPKFKILRVLKTAMSQQGFDLGEETVDGKIKIKNKCVNGTSMPAYSYIRRKVTEL